MRNPWITGVALLLSSLAFSQAPKRILLEHGHLHVGNGQVYERALIGIEGEKIILIKNSLAYTYRREDWDTIIDLEGQHVYPGFMAPNSTLGLTEIDAIRATRDFSEAGIYNPHVRALIAFNAESKVIATVRSNGVLIGQATPRGGQISGTSSVMHLGGWNWEDAVVKADDGVHLNWPASLQGGGWWAEPAEKKRNQQYDEQKRSIVQFFEQARAYASTTEPAVKDLRFEAMKALFNGEKRLYVHASEIQQLLDVIDFAKQEGIRFPVIVGGYDSYLITQRLKDANIPVMLPRLHSLPENEEDAVDLPYRLPTLLQAGGVKFCLQNEGDMEAMNARNIPFLAGTAMAYGLTEEEAIRSVSLSSCEITGISQNYGSIEEGKNATLFVSRGNALDMRTNEVTTILMDGVFVSPDNTQTALYKKYMRKYQK